MDLKDIQDMQQQAQKAISPKPRRPQSLQVENEKNFSRKVSFGNLLPLLPQWISTSFHINSEEEKQILEKDDVTDIFSSNNEQMNGLISHAKQMSGQLQNMVESNSNAVDLVKDGKPINYEELVGQLQIILKHQREINQATTRMTSTNYLVNMVNFVRNKQLKFMVQRGKEQLEETTKCVNVLEHNIDSLNTEISVQKMISDRLKSSLESTKQLLDSSINEYREEISRQREILSQQQSALSDLFKSKFNQDFIVDSSLFGLSLYFTNSFIVEYPLHLILALSGRGKSAYQRKMFLKQLIKLIIIVSMMRFFQGYALFYGLHNRVGNIYQYTVSMYELLLKKLFAFKEQTKNNENKS